MEFKSRNVTTRCNIASDLNPTAILLAYVQVELKFFQESEAQAVGLLCFLRQKRTRERFTLGSTTETGNEKPSTLRKSTAISKYVMLR